jgi:hypothetical protein
MYFFHDKNLNRCESNHKITYNYKQKPCRLHNSRRFFKNLEKPVRGAAFSRFSRYFIWKKNEKQTFFKTRSGSGFFEVLAIFYLGKKRKTNFFQNPFGERLFQGFLDILFGKKIKNKLFSKPVRETTFKISRKFVKFVAKSKKDKIFAL